MITLRPANMGDAKKLLDWRNDPAARNNFFNSEVVEFDQHLSWLKKVLRDANRHLFIILNENNKEIGQVRFDVNADEAEMSVTIGKDFRGRGYGTEAIKDSAAKFLAENKKFTKIITRIKLKNKLSLAAFEKAGFVEVSRDSAAVCMKFAL